MFCKNWGGCGSCEEEESFWKLYIQLVFGTALLLRWVCFQKQIIKKYFPYVIDLKHHGIS